MADCWHGMSDEAERAQEAHERQRLEVEDHISAAIRRGGAWVMGPRSSLSSWSLMISRCRLVEFVGPMIP